MRSTLAALILALSPTALAQTPELSQQVVEPGPRPKFGIAASTGLEVVLPVEAGEVARFSARAGAGVRLALAAFDDESMSTLPALSLIGGVAAQSTATAGDFRASGFVETHLELAVVANQNRALLQPAALAYLIGGVTLREGVVVPHFGIGVGWGILFLWSTESGSSFFKGWGRVDGAGAAALVFAAAVAAAGRIELRYVPATGALPGATSVLLGFGF